MTMMTLMMIKITVIMIAIMIMMIKMILIIAIVIIMINSPFQPGDFSNGSTTAVYIYILCTLVHIHIQIFFSIPVVNKVRRH